MEKGILKIYRASAGSGKTQKLAENYLKLVFNNPDKYSRILAITFTNKATEEMKARILSELFLISGGEESQIKKTLLKEFTWLNEETLKLRANEILLRILYDYSRFEIHTIDSFFQKVIRGFAGELNIQYGYNVELDTARMLDEAIDLMFEGLRVDDTLTGWLSDFARDKMKEEKNWDLKREIERFAQEIFKESFQKLEFRIREKLKDRDFLRKYSSQMFEITSVFEKTIQAKAKEAVSLIEELGLNVDDFSYKDFGVAGYLHNLSWGIIKEPTNKALLAVDNIDAWFAKGANTVKDIFRPVFNRVNNLLKEIVQYYERELPRYISAISIRRYLNVLGILNDISEKVTQIRDKDNLMLISDVNLLLKHLISSNDAPFIYEKTGSRFQHFLVDEFQDTSAFQWNNIAPLIQNSLSENHSNMVVGDIKQSIYRWRNGDWNLMLRQIYEDIRKEQYETFGLDSNWRSEENIILFNNALFPVAALILQTEINNQLTAAKNVSPENRKLLQNIIRNAYQDVEQVFPKDKKKNRGFVRLSFFSKDEFQERVEEYLVNSVEELVAHGYKPSDITILVRDSKNGRKAADLLFRRTKYRVVSNDSLLLNASAKVRLLVAAVKYIRDNQDALSMAELLQIWHLIEKKNDPPVESAFQSISQNPDYLKAILPAAFLDNLENLHQLPLYELAEELIRIFGLNEVDGEMNFVQAFLDAILEFSNTQVPDFEAFLEWWEENISKKAVQIPEKSDAIRIMTIHKAKGLAFKVVIIPFCLWALDHEAYQENILWCEPGSTPFNQMDLVPLKYQKSLENTDFADCYFTEKVSTFIDNLNLLYVAFTRAREGMVISAPKPKDENLKKISDLLHLVFKKESILHGTGLLTKYWSDEKSQFEIGKIEVLENYDNYDTGTFIPAEYISNRPLLKLRMKKDPWEQFLDKKDMKLTGIYFGKLMHEIFSKIITLEDLRGITEEYYFSGLITKEEMFILQKEFMKIMENRQMREWFDGSWDIRTESTIVLPGGDMRIPDRVMQRHGQVVILDFKFGEQEPWHRKQVHEYMELLLKMGNRQVSGFLYYYKEHLLTEVSA